MSLLPFPALYLTPHGGSALGEWVASGWSVAKSQHQASSTLLPPALGTWLGRSIFGASCSYLPGARSEGDGWPCAFPFLGLSCDAGQGMPDVCSAWLGPCLPALLTPALIFRLFLMVFGNSLERPHRHSLIPSSACCGAACKTVSPLSQGHA